MKKTKLAALISLTLANIAGLCLVTFAWFTCKNTVDSSADTISAYAPDEVSVTHKIFSWDDDLRQGIECLNNDGTYKFGLEQYDSYILERNARLSKIIRFELHRDVIDTVNDVTFGVTIPCSGLLFDSSNNVTNSISNIIRFRYFLDATNNGDDANTVYNNALDYANANINSDVYVSSFVKLTTEGNVTTASKDYSLVIDNLHFEENSDVTYFFLEYNYDVDLINYYYEHSEMEAPGPDSLEGDEVQFVGDINRMAFGVNHQS